MNSTRLNKRMVKFVSRCVLVLAMICLVVTALPADGFKVMAADATNVTVGSVDEWVANVQNAPSGSVLNVEVSQSFGLAYGQTLHIGSGVTVNLYMNNQSIMINYGEWDNINITLIKNGGTLNIYAGSKASPNRGNATISSNNTVTGMGAEDDYETAECNVVSIENSGKIVVNAGVSIVATGNLEYTKVYNSVVDRSGHVHTMATGIYNASANAVCEINAASVSATAIAQGVTRDRNQDQAAYAYGRAIYGGEVTVNGNANISAVSRATNETQDGRSDRIIGLSEAYCIASDGLITINGGNFNVTMNYTEGLEKASKQFIAGYTAVIGYVKTVPVITDGTFNVTVNANALDSGDVTENSSENNEVEFKQFSVAYVSDSYLAPQLKEITYDWGVFDKLRAASRNTGGNYYDENGYLHVPGASNSAGNTVKTVNGGAPTNNGAQNKTRMHLIYRFWETSGKKELRDFVFDGMQDSRITNKADILVNGTKVTDYALKVGDVVTIRMYDSANTYYWQAFNVAVATSGSNPVKWYNEFASENFSSAGTAYDKPQEPTGTTADGKNYWDITYTVSSSAAQYIYIDYTKQNANNVNVSVADTVNVTYSGKAPVPNDTAGFNIKITQYGNSSVDWTQDYNLANKADPDNKLVAVSYSYVNKANAADKGEGLPIAAGTYSVTMLLADDTDIAFKYSKNRKQPAAKTFTLVINRANATRGNLPDDVSLIFGETIGGKVNLSNAIAKGVESEDLTGTFTFNGNAADFAAVGARSIGVTWKPSGASMQNYAETTFTINFTVAPATLTITPNAASIVYGESEFTSNFGASISGLVANDATESKTAQILSALTYSVLHNGNYVAYVPGEFNVGTYTVRPALVNAPSFLNNYEVVYNFNEASAQLTVTARPLTVSAVAQTRAYNPDDFTANVTLTITDGIFADDNVVISSAVGQLDKANNKNTVGIQPVIEFTTATAQNALTGEDKGNYVVTRLTYADEANALTVEIVKAEPGVTVPTVAGIRYYTYNGKLSDINLNANNYTPEVAGTWNWVSPDINPQVLADTYTAVFEPDDSANYLTLTAEIPVEILASDVHITYNANLTYGDPRPDLTQYTYTCATDTAFDIKKVTTSGNIYPSTTYDQFDGVTAEGYVVTLNNVNYKDINGNYNLIVENGLITVSPKTIRVIADNATITYGDRFDAVVLGTHTVTYSDDFVGSDTPNALTKDGTAPKYIFTSDYNYQTNYNVGTYNITVEMLEEDKSPNYQITFVSGSLKVEKAELVVAGKTINVNYLDAVDLNGAYTLTGLVHNEKTLADAGIGEPSVDTTYAAGSPVVDGGYAYIFDFSNIPSANYRITTKSGVIIVNKINPVITAYPTATLPFGSVLADAAFSAFTASVGGKFVFDAADAKPPYSSNPYNEDVVVYTATFVPDDTVNYNVLNNQKVVLTIEKCAITGAPLITGYPMAGQELKADLSAMYPAASENYIFTWTVNGTVKSNATTYTVENENDVIVLTVTAAGPYTGSASNSVTASRTLTIADLETVLNIAGLENKTYNATQQGVAVTNKNDSEVLMGNITVKYNGSATIPTNAGTYGVTVDIALPDNFGTLTVEERDGQTYVGSQKVYAPAVNISIGTFTIAPAAFNVNVTVADKEYDGTNIATAEITDIVNGAINTVSGLDYVSFDEANATYYFADANAGTNKAVTVGNVALIGESKDNYVLTVSITNANAGVINKKELKAIAVAENREYEAGNTTVAIAFDMDLSTLATGDTDADVYFNPAFGSVASDKAGTQNVIPADGSITLGGSKAANYTWTVLNLDSLTVVIDKATPDYPMPEIGILTYDSGRTLDDISLGDSRWSWENGNVKPVAGTQTYTAVFKPADTVNYKTVTKEVTLVINKAQIVITATSYTLTYGDPAPTYAYTVSGLTGADTLASVATGYAIVNCAYDLGSPVRAEGYPVTVTGYFTGDNYDFRYVQGLVTVNPRPVYSNATVADRNFSASNYDVAITFGELTNVYAPDNGNVKLSSYATTGTVENNAAGTRAVKYTAPVLTGSAAGNYVLVVNPTELTVEILKAKPLNVLMPTTATVIYGSPLASAVFTSAKEGDGTFRLENATSYPVAHGVFSDVYKVEFIPTDSANYATLSAYITLTVEKKPLAVAAALSGARRAGETVYVVTSAIDDAAAPYITYEWYRLKNAGDSLYMGVKLAEGIGYTLTDSDVDYYIACAVTVNSAAPYSCDAIAVSDSPIEEVKMTFWQKLWAWFYKIFASISNLFGKMGG